MAFTAQQLRALAQPAAFAFETMRPGLRRQRGRHSEILSINRGYE